ncbi:MAG: hypothetical protein DCF25_17260 [Leptolyngbya foveolarum]|uniref:Uncharacterized protein n=1 Tax=Leptolyngbya foveolarum TaxID=47253 RepID=A0A2W4TUZ9_9CYAN|nr:MAG: hypothetical protein DCF25_17260 [Leptolyngbya foveolarum]
MIIIINFAMRSNHKKTLGKYNEKIEKASYKAKPEPHVAEVVANIDTLSAASSVSRAQTMNLLAPILLCQRLLS